MKMWMLGVAAVCVAMATTVMAAEQNIGVVNMNELVKAHPEAASDKAALEERIVEFEAEHTELMSQMDALKAEIREIGKQAESKALSAAAREEALKGAEGKLLEFRRLQRQVRETSVLRQKQVAEQRARMQERLTTKLREIVKAYAKGKYTLVLDSSVLAAGAIGAVVYHEDAVDITAELVEIVGGSTSPAE